MRKKARLLAVLFLLIPLAMTFAGGSSAKSEAGKTRTFAVIYPVIHPVFEPVNEGALEKAKEMGVNVEFHGPDVADPAQQIQIVENLIAKRVDGIAIGPTDSAALTPLINRAIERGIKVLCFDTDAPQSNRAGYIGTININFGRHMGEVLGQTLNGKGNVLVSQGVATQQNLIERLQGVKEVCSQKYPDIKFIDEQSGAGDPNRTLANIENMVKAHPDFDALIGIDAAAGPAAAIVWKAQSLKQPVIVGDDTSDIIQGVKDGYITYTIAQNQYIWGQKIVEELNDLCDGKSIPESFDAGTRAVDGKNVWTTAQYNK
ncbi:MAG: substrate-binding domain-containing protein [Treponema sp.]|jgi:ribose transport system substrate-binding protein|nr:substrate-binding domain-containing protein [Treponema sp.]